MMRGRLRQTLGFINHQYRGIAEGAQAVAGRQSGRGPETGLVHLDIEIEEHRRLPRQDVFHQSRLADLTAPRMTPTFSLARISFNGCSAALLRYIQYNITGYLA